MSAAARGSVLVAGGAGFVGSHVVLALARAGREVVVLDDLSAGRRDAVLHGELVVGSIGDDALVRATCRRRHVTAAIHLAGRIRVDESVAEPAAYAHANVELTGRLVASLRAEGVGRLVFSSSAAVYGAPSVVPIPESHPLAPSSPYGWTKVAAEEFLAASGLRVAALRYFNAAGAAAADGLAERHEPESHLIPRAIDAALAGLPFTVNGDDWPTPDGSCVRDYVHVEDLADAHVAALDRLEGSDGEPGRTGAGSGFRAWNLGAGRGSSVREVVAAIEAAVGRRLDVRVGPRREGDPASLVADVARARAELAFRAPRSALARIVADAVASRRDDARGTGRAAGRPSGAGSARSTPGEGGAPCAR